MELKEHDVITIDGSTGEVYLGTVDRRSATEDEDFQTVLKWADDLRELKVKAGGEGIWRDFCEDRRATHVTSTCGDLTPTLFAAQHAARATAHSSDAAIFTTTRASKVKVAAAAKIMCVPIHRLLSAQVGPFLDAVSDDA